MLKQIYISYFDVNNQYGAAMSQSSPYSNFERIHNYTTITFWNIPDDSSEGFILEVDLEYPESP